MEWRPNDQELHLIKEVFHKLDASGTNSVGGRDAFDFLSRTNHAKEFLRQVKTN